MMDNSQKIILDLCGGTGSWSRPYKEAGYDVRLVTLPDNDVRTYEPPENVYGILAAPPCTEFSSAKNGRGKRDIAGAMEIVEGCERVIRRSMMTGSLRFWALENPEGKAPPGLCLNSWGIRITVLNNGSLEVARRSQPIFGDSSTPQSLLRC